MGLEGWKDIKAISGLFRPGASSQMDIWMPYGEVEVSIEVEKGDMADLLEPKLHERTDWIEAFKDNIERGTVLGLDPALIALGGENLVRLLSETVGEKASENRLKILLASNLYSMPLNVNEDRRVFDFKMESWRGTAPDLILAALLPHPFFGLCGAPHLAALGHLEFPSLLKNLDLELLVEGVKAESLKDNSVTASILEGLASESYAIHLVPYRGKLIPVSEGNIIEAFKEGMRRYIDFFKIGGKHALLVVSVGGSPFDATVLNMLHTLKTTWNVVVDRGELILLSECGNVLADPYLLRDLIGLTSQHAKKPLVEALRREVSKITNRISVRLVSTLPNSYVGKLGFKSADTATAAFQLARRRIRETKASFLSWGYHAIA